MTADRKWSIHSSFNLPVLLSCLVEMKQKLVSPPSCPCPAEGVKISSRVSSCSCQFSATQLLCQCFCHTAALPVFLPHSCSASVSATQLLCQCFCHTAALPVFLPHSCSCQCFCHTAALSVFLPHSCSASVSATQLLCACGQCFCHTAALPVFCG